MVLCNIMSDSNQGSTWIRNYTEENEGWHDLIGPITFFGTDISDPTRSQILSSGHMAYKFDIGKRFEILYHLQHDFRSESPIYVHVHWVSDGSDPNPVTWGFHFQYARGFARGYYDFSGSENLVTVTEAPQPPQGDNLDQLCHMTSPVIVPFESELFEPDGIILMQLQRLGNADAVPAVEADDNTDGIFVLTCDCHYRSHGYSTKNRLPPWEY